MASQADSPFLQLHRHLVSRGHQGLRWDHLLAARERTDQVLGQLSAALPGELPVDDVSVVVSGSLGRGEFTSGSDIDWNLLLDGVADPKHFHLARDVGASVNRFAAKATGREGTFGGRVVSHDLIHRIGGEEDSNSNLTRRMLLLLESKAIGPSLAFRRTFRNVLERYLQEDRSFWSGTTVHGHHVPHFLLNDLTRFWRTMAVDFAYKLRDRQGNGSIVRNLKLRMSRKIIFVAGLLACFRCQLDFPSPERRAEAYAPDNQGSLFTHVESVFRLDPAEIIASVLLRAPHLHPQAVDLFNAYDVFLGLLADPDTRQHLEQNPPPSDALRVQAFDASRQFREALLQIFFDEPSGLGELTRRYGIF